MTKIEAQARIVYIVGESSTGLLKVGISKNANSLARRLQNLQTGNPRELKILTTFNYGQEGLAYSVEQDTIKAFSMYQYGLAGDWFDTTIQALTAYIMGGILP